MRPDVPAAGAARPTFLEEDSNGWLVTFSDLVLQLFAFIVVAAVVGRGVGLPAPSEPLRLDVEPERVAASPHTNDPDALSLARFDDLPLRMEPPAATVTFAVAGAASPDRTSAATVVAAPAHAMTPAVVPAPEPAANSLAAELEAFVGATGLGDAVQVSVNGGGVILSISDTIGFASGSAELLADALPVLAEVRSLLDVRADLAVEVAGHTDDVPVRGGAYHSNLDLSLARAARVAHELSAGNARLADRVFAAGYGPQRPVASNGDAEGRARNRRVEIRLVPAGDPASVG